MQKIICCGYSLLAPRQGGLMSKCYNICIYADITMHTFLYRKWMFNPCININICLKDWFVTSFFITLFLFSIRSKASKILKHFYFEIQNISKTNKFSDSFGNDISFKPTITYLSKDQIVTRKVYEHWLVFNVRTWIKKGKRKLRYTVCPKKNGDLE